MATIQKAQVKTVAAPARQVAPVPARMVAAPARQAAPIAKKVATTNRVREIAGFTVTKGLDIPPRKAFGGKKGVFNELFSQLEVGDAVDIHVDAGKKNTSKMNSLYNAARRNGAVITVRVMDSGENGDGGVLRMWYQGQTEQA